MFSIEVRPKEKVFFFLASGFFSTQEAHDFLDIFKRKLATIDPTEYTLVADGSTLQVSAADTVPLLRQCLILYKEIPFRKRYLVAMESHLAQAQAQRLIEEVGLDIEVVGTIEEVKYE